MPKSNKPSWMKKLELKYKRFRVKVDLPQYNLVSTSAPINEEQSLELQGCKVVGNPKTELAMLKDCDIKIVSKRVRVDKPSSDMRVNVELDDEE